MKVVSLYDGGIDPLDGFSTRSHVIAFENGKYFISKDKFGISREQLQDLSTFGIEFDIESFLESQIPNMKFREIQIHDLDFSKFSIGNKIIPMVRDSRIDEILKD